MKQPPNNSTGWPFHLSTILEAGKEVAQKERSA